MGAPIALPASPLIGEGSAKCFVMQSVPLLWDPLGQAGCPTSHWAWSELPLKCAKYEAAMFQHIGWKGKIFNGMVCQSGDREVCSRELGSVKSQNLILMRHFNYPTFGIGRGMRSPERDFYTTKYHSTNRRKMSARPARTDECCFSRRRKARENCVKARKKIASGKQRERVLRYLWKKQRKSPKWGFPQRSWIHFQQYAIKPWVSIIIPLL